MLKLCLSLFSGSILAVMGSPNLDGLMEEWEANTTLRDYMRAKKCLLAPAPRFLEPECNVACAEKNFDVMAPIAKRLRLPDGSVGQVLVPSIMKEKFVFNWLILFLVFCPKWNVFFGVMKWNFASNAFLAGLI